MMRLILARHGQSIANIIPKMENGHLAPLTELGEQQANRLGQWLKANEPEIDLIVCSEFTRARQTAEIANKYLNLPLKVDPNLNELERFDLPILPRRKHPFEPDSAYRTPEDDGYYDSYRAKVHLALHSLMADLNRPKPILVVSHGGTSATLMRLMLERHDLFIRTNNAAMHFFSWNEGCWRIDAMNFTRHLPDELIS